MPVRRQPPRAQSFRALTPRDHIEGVLERDRARLGRTITLIESELPRHQEQAQEVLRELLPHTGRAHRVGVSGVPGVGKSTLIESLGLHLLEEGHRVAVLAVDPSSSRSGGSILGDKTRMVRLSKELGAFVRPSPSRGSLGGVARKTRETILVCEAAGFDVVLVETVGVGQSEAVVADMVDTFLVLLLAGAGDELQGIKRGILELADVLAVTKADGGNRQRAERARRDYAAALHYLPPPTPAWSPPVLTCSSLEGEGLTELWATLREHRETLESSGDLAARRHHQQLRWMWSLVEEGLLERLRRHPDIERELPRLQGEVGRGDLNPSEAARRLLEIFAGSSDPRP